jgi:hypothetical protein
LSVRFEPHQSPLSGAPTGSSGPKALSMQVTRFGPEAASRLLRLGFPKADAQRRASAARAFARVGCKHLLEGSLFANLSDKFGISARLHIRCHHCFEPRSRLLLPGILECAEKVTNIAHIPALDLVSEIVTAQ